MFNKDSFIVPINNDATLKIRDVNANIVYYIKDPNCTTKVNNNLLQIKQSSESKLISLKFDLPKSAIEAHTILRNELIKLKNNIKTSHLHEQTTPSKTWLIDHNLGRYTHVTIYDDVDNLVLAEVEKISTNGIRILFSEPTAGKAFIS